MDTTSVAGTPSKIFSTPSRPVTQERYASLREKVVRESPYLYKNKVLSNPVKQEKQENKSTGVKLSNAFSPRADYEKKAVEGDVLLTGGDGTLGAFENPILAQYSRRIVNKELETRRIISNLLAVLIWNLILRFLNLFLDHTQRGSQWSEWLAKWVQEKIVYRINPYTDLEQSRWISLLSLGNISHVFHLVVFYNVTVSFWRLLVKSQHVKVDDLHLNYRQKQLLGVSDTPQVSHTLPKVTLAAASQDTPVKSATGAPVPVKPSTQPVFLFKSLQTPQKSKERAAAEHAGIRSEQVNKVNAFGDLRTSVLRNVSLTPAQDSNVGLTVPITRTGYIPSSKYAYMRDSPSPRKSM